ncbi:protein kinase domain-containing protein [Candidatus Leptofilum sp.]|uniref:protein kinase domain-containing protein n=1 Tax=Candidatus Leptofilum sp. TaxID=3241576 RepID=UPI003B591CF9
MDNLVGQQIDQYLIERHLARGGMANVYLAQDVYLQRPVAIKIMLSGLIHDKELIARFQREAQAIAKLNHPNIIQIYTTGLTETGLPYLAMQYIPGGSLQEEMTHSADGGQRLSTQRVLALAGQVADALRAAHKAGIVHRDLKPSNILLREDGTAVVTDLGIAAVQEASARLTRTGHVMGTPYYMSPEQAMGRSVDGRTDIYALGVILYEMLSGTVPFKADSPLAILSQHLYEPPPPLIERRHDLSVTTHQTIEMCLQKEPEKRFQTAEQLRAALNQALQAETNPRIEATELLATPQRQPAVAPPTPTPATQPAATPKKQRPRWLPYAAGGAVVVALIATAILFWPDADDPSTPTAEPPPAVADATDPAELAITTFPTATLPPEPTETVAPTETAVPTSTHTPLPTNTPLPTPIPPIVSANVNAPFFNFAPTIDGNLDEWLGVTPVLAAHRTFEDASWDGSEDLTAAWQLAWDGNNLYLAVTVTDDIHAQSQSAHLIFQGDSVDMQLDTNRQGDLSNSLNSDDFQITFSPGDFNALPPSVWRWTATSGGTIVDAPDHAIIVQSRRTESGYVVEAAVPWRDLNVTPSTGLVLGASFNATDNDQVGTAVQELFYSHVASRTLLSPNTWGTLTLTSGN